MLIRLAGAALAVSALACGAPERRPVPLAPSLYRPAEAIPADLDVAVRIDLKRIRRRLDADTLTSLGGRMVQPNDPPGAGLLNDAMKQADAVWIAYRPGPDFLPMDSVVVLEGDFEGIRPREYTGKSRWSSERDLGGDWRRFVRPPPTRSSPAVLYAHGNRLLVVATPAEIDAVERTVEMRAGGSHLDPPERGAVAFELRLPILAQRIATQVPHLAEVLARGDRLSGSVDLSASGFVLLVEATFRAPEDAEELSRLVESVAKRFEDRGPVASLVASRVKVDVAGVTTTARLELDDRELALAAGVLKL